MEAVLAAVEPEPLKLTVNGAGPAAVEDESTAVGGVTGTGVVEAVAVIVVNAVLV